MTASPERLVEALRASLKENERLQREKENLEAAAAEPISDVRASADYRRAMAEVVARRVITTAVARARGETVLVPASSAVFAAGGAS